MGRRQFTPEFKTKIVLEILKEEKQTINKFLEATDQISKVIEFKNKIKQTERSTDKES